MTKELISKADAEEVGKQAALAFTAPKGQGWGANLTAATLLIEAVDAVGTPEQKAALLTTFAQTVKEQDAFRKKV